MDLYNVDQGLGDTLALGVDLVIPPWASQRSITLEDLRRHGAFEHDASISRSDYSYGDHVNVNRTLVEEFLEDGEGDFITIQSLAKTRTRRAKESQDFGSPALSYGAAATAYGEAGIILNLFGLLGQPDKKGLYAPKKMLEQWFLEERIPDGWTRPKQAITSAETVYTAAKVLAATEVGSVADYLPDSIGN